MPSGGRPRRMTMNAMTNSSAKSGSAILSIVFVALIGVTLIPLLSGLLG